MNTELKVGAFMIVSILVLGATIYFVRTTQTVRGQVAYKTYLRYAGGLAPGAAVLFGGIKAGQVTAVQPWIEDPTRIEVGFQVKIGTPVNQNSTARVGSVSLMTSPVLLITTGSNDASRLTAGQVVSSEEAVSLEDLTGRVAVLAESANQLIKELRGEIPALTEQARTLLANLNEISGPANQKRVEQVLAELNTLLDRESPKIAQITDQISTLAKHADSVVVSVEPVVANVDRTVTNVNATIDAIREPLTKDLAELELTIQQARTLLGSIQNVVQTNDTDIAEMMRNLRSASENIQALTESLEQRPWGLLRIKQPADRKVPQ